MHEQILPLLILHPNFFLFITESFYNKWFLTPSPSTHHPWSTLTRYSRCHYLVCTGLLCMVTGPSWFVLTLTWYQKRAGATDPRAPSTVDVGVSACYASPLYYYCWMWVFAIIVIIVSTHFTSPPICTFWQIFFWNWLKLWACLQFGLVLFSFSFLQLLLLFYS